MNNLNNKKYLQIIQSFKVVNHRYYMASFLVLFAAISALVLCSCTTV